MPAEVQAGKPRIDLASYQLSLEGGRVRLERQPMDLLIFLVQRRGQLVSRQEIIEKLWGKDVFVDVDGSINAVVRKIRWALKDDPANPKYLETVIGKGYRFVGDIELAGATSAIPERAATDDEPSAAMSGWNRRRLLLVCGGFLILLVFVVWGSWRYKNTTQQHRIHSLAVLPIANLSGDSSQDYFADGMTDELITDLGTINNLQVISRTSVMRYKGTGRTLPEIARELKVDAIVEGSVVRSGNQVRITAQLIEASTDKHLWAQSYERELKDVLSIQDEVALNIAQQVERQFSDRGSAKPASAPAVNPDAYEAYLHGRSLLNEYTESRVLSAVEAFKQSLRLQPNYAPAYAGMAQSYLSLGWKYLPMARVAAERAVALDDKLAEAHDALAMSMLQDFDWPGADRELLRALAINPNAAQTHGHRALYLAAMGRLKESVSEAQIARDLDPVSPAAFIRLGFLLYFAHSYDAAIENEKKALQLESDLTRPHYWMGHCYNEKSTYQEAIEQIHKVNRSQDEDGIFLAALGRSHALAGEHTKALRIRVEFEKLSKRQHVWPTDAAFFYAALGENDQAFDWLEKAIQEKDGWLFFLNVDPRVDKLRSDPRFARLVSRVGLPQAE